MKRIISALVLALVLLLGMTASAMADIVENGNCGASGAETNVTWTLDDKGMLTISGVGKMYNYWFDDAAPWTENSSVKHVVIESGVTRIGSFAFSDCSSLESATIADTVTSIEASAFRNCAALKTVTFADDSQLERIEAQAFFACGALESITLPASLNSLDYSAFQNCGELNAVHIQSGGTTYKSVDGVLYSADGKTLILYPQGKEDTAFAIPVGVTAVGRSAFSSNQHLTQISIPDSVVEIGEYAFSGCEKLESVVLGENSSLQRIEEGAFTRCTALESFTIPASVNGIGDYAFDYDYASGFSLKEVIVPCTWDGSLYSFSDWMLSKEIHIWEYTASGASIARVCSNSACGENGGKVTLIPPENLIYDGAEKTVIVKDVEGSFDAAAVPAVNYSGDRTNAGTFTASLTIGDATASVTCTIEKKELTVDSLTAVGRSYNQELTVDISEGVLSGIAGSDNVELDLSVAKGTMENADAGENKPVMVSGLKLSGDHAENYTLSTQLPTVTVTITKADCALTAPTANTLTYTGEPQALVAAGTATGGELQHSLDGENYSASIPTGTDAGDYAVYYKVAGDNNHNDTAAQTMTVSMAKAEPIAPTGLAATYGQTLADIALPDGWTWVNPDAAVGSAGVNTHKANYTESENYFAAQNVDVTVTVGKILPPTPEGIVAVYGQTLAQVALPDGWTWANSSDAVGDAGENTHKANCAESENYLAAQNVDVTVTVGKVLPTAPEGIVAAYGQTLAQVALPDGWTWVNPDAAVGSAGENAHKANYAESENYLAAQNVDVVVTVGQAQTELTAKADKESYLYGEYVMVAVKSAAADVSAFSLRRFAAPKAGEVSLWNGDMQIAAPQAAGNGDEVTFQLDTVEAGLVPGSYTLTAKYEATDDMAAQSAEVSFTVAYAEAEEKPEASGDKNEAGVYGQAPTLTAPDGSQIATECGPEAKWADSLTLPAENGTHTYTYYVKLPDGTIAEQTVTVTVDTAAPVVQAPTILADPTSAQITAPAMDAVSGVLDYTLTAESGKDKDKLIITDKGDGSFDVTGMIPGEVYDFTLTVTDKAGHATVVEITVTAPELPVIPQTGDDSRMALWLMLLGMAGAGMLALRRRAKN